MKQVDTRASLSPREFSEEYFERHLPVVYSGAIKDTSYFQNWSFEYLKSVVGDRPVYVAFSNQGYFKFHDKAFFEWKEIPFSTAIDNFTSPLVGKNYYLQQTPLDQVFPELADELTLPPLSTSTDKILFRNLWIGGTGCISPLHKDSLPNFLVQVRGRKKLIMYSPEDTQNLYPGTEKETSHMSSINLRNVDSEQFPLFVNASPIECTIEAGDILYIPTGWWHEVYSLEASISVNYWFIRFDATRHLDSQTPEVLNEILQVYVEKGVDLNGNDDFGEPYLTKCISKGYNNLLRALLNLGIKPINHQGRSPIEHAQITGNQGATDLLMAYRNSY